MQFHHHGYVSGDPRVKDAEGLGIDLPADLPDEIDVLIVGSGPAGMLLAAQMSQYPDVSTRIIEKSAVATRCSSPSTTLHSMTISCEPRRTTSARPVTRSVRGRPR